MELRFYDVFSVPTRKRLEYREKICEDCLVLSLSLQELLELVQKCRGAEYHGVTIGEIAKIYSVASLTTPDHVDEPEGMMFHIAFGKNRGETLLVLELSHFEHSSKDDVIAVLNLMTMLEQLFGGTAYIQLWACNGEYLAITLYPDTQGAIVLHTLMLCAKEGG